MTAKETGAIRFIGFLVGGVLAVGLVLSGRVPESRAGAGATLTIETQPTTELGVSQAGELLSERSLAPGGRKAHETIGLANYTGRALSVGLRASSGGRDLDRVLLLEIATGGERTFRGPLGELRTWTAATLTLAPRQKRRVAVRAWIPSSVRDGYQGRSTAIELEWKVGG